MDSSCLKGCLIMSATVAFFIFVASFLGLLANGSFAGFSPDMMARGFTDLGESWWGGVAWALRGPGVALALLTLPIAYLAALLLQLRSQESKMPQNRPPTDLPAAAVAILVEHMVTSRTLLTIVLEMCQRGTLEITGVRDAPRRSKSGDFDYRGEYRYRVKSLEEPRFSWERTVCDALLKVEVSARVLASLLGEQKCDISRQIESYLRHRGLLHAHPMAKANPARRVRILPRLGGLLLFTGLVMWLIFLEGPWEAMAMAGFTASFIGGIAYLYGAMTVGRMGNQY